MTSTEKVLLRSLAAKRINIIENKKTNGAWVDQKKKTWKNISEEFCSNQNVVKRSGEKLQKACDNMTGSGKTEVKISNAPTVIY